MGSEGISNSQVMYTAEFQKQGLPHCHTLVCIDERSWVQRDEDIDAYISVEVPSKDVDPECHRVVSELILQPDLTLIYRELSRVQRDEDIYAYISAELPSKDVDHECHRVVSELMMHGLYGPTCPTAPCTQYAAKCTKHFPKEYCNRTYIDKYGFFHYRGRDTGVTTVKQNVELDNGYVVPFNKQLSTTFYAHINIEYCRWAMIIKYLFKYISKGTFHIAARVSRSSTTTLRFGKQAQVIVDDIKNFLDARYISPHEAFWRLFEFDIHNRELAVQILAVHLQNMQLVVFRSKDRLQSVADNPHKKKITLTEWLEYNAHYTDERHLTMSYVHPAAGDLFYQRILLCHQKGCRSFHEICIVNDMVYQTCRATCEVMGLLGDDREWETTLQEASLTATPAEL
ncbi:hypothetical protein Tco_0648571 [Tanacetum coccineum]